MGLPFDQGIRDKLPGGEQLQLGAADDDPNLGEAEWERLLEVLSSKKLVMHNGLYDCVMLEAGTRHWRGRDLTAQLKWDTMVAHRVLFPTDSAGLDNAAKQLQVGKKEGLDQVQSWLESGKHPKYRYDLVPWWVIRPYVTADAEATLALMYEQLRRLEHDAEYEGRRGSLAEEVRREVELTRTLARMEMRGLGFDAETSLEEAERLEREADALEARMPFDCTPTAAKQWFFERQKLSADRATKKGEPSLDDEQVKDWIADGVKWAAEYRQVKRSRLAVSMWFRGYPEKMGADGRLRTRFRQGTVASGRLSSERINLQAMPKADKTEEDVANVRELLRAREGHQLWSLDMSQAELRVAAKYAGCQSMIDALETGDDFHARTTERVLHVTPDAPDWKLKRDIGKRLTFASLFSVGAERFQAVAKKDAGVVMTLGEAESLVYGWRSTYPEFPKAWKVCEHRFEERGYMRILPGTEYESRSYMGPRDWPHTGWNRLVQGSLAAWTRLWLVWVEELLPGALVLTVHDSVVLELPEDTAEDQAETMQELTKQRATQLFGITMPCDRERYA